jgi:hypothetical protein
MLARPAAGALHRWSDPVDRFGMALRRFVTTSSRRSMRRARQLMKSVNHSSTKEIAIMDQFKQRFTKIMISCHKIVST